MDSSPPVPPHPHPEAEVVPDDAAEGDPHVPPHELIAQQIAAEQTIISEIEGMINVVTGARNTIVSLAGGLTTELTALQDLRNRNLEQLHNLENSLAGGTPSRPPVKLGASLYLLGQTIYNLSREVSPILRKARQVLNIGRGVKRLFHWIKSLKGDN